MLSSEENDLLTRVGPATPLGELMRRYWLPALLSGEVAEPDDPPVRVRLLGEQLLAFRDTQGRIGLLDEFCAHRGTSLWLGRNEECGIRCVFHGWKYDVDGYCVDQMNEPESFAHKIKLQAYPTVEMGGIVWAYMGPPEKQPPEPKFEWTQVPEASRFVTKTWEECNWLQALEGGIDTSHASILHRTLVDDTKHPGIRPSALRGGGRAPRLEVRVTDYGYRYLGIVAMGERGYNVRGYHFVLPFTQIRPFPQRTARIIPGHMWAPMDDENCMVYNWIYSFGEAPLTEEQREEPGSGRTASDIDPTHGYRKLSNKDNNWLIDRAVQKYETFTGIDGINTQDHATQESMGPIVDRTREHLGPADKAIIAARQLLLKAIQTVREGGDPPGVEPSYYNLRAAPDRILPAGVDWWQALRDELEVPLGA